MNVPPVLPAGPVLPAEPVLPGEPVLLDEHNGKSYPIGVPRWRSDAKAPLRVSDLPGIRRGDIDQGTRSLWRYRRALPLNIAAPVTLGEGGTPLLRAEFRGHMAHFKLEWMAPTGSFKDRGAAVMLSALRQQGVRAVVEDSSGNAAAAIAAYGAAAGMRVHILAPAGTQPAKIAQIKAYGADLRLIPGPREASEAAAHAMAETIFYASHNWHPLFIQGVKTIGYEIWEDLGFRAPDNIIVPAGAGSNVLGCDLAFRELLAAGEITHLPRIFAIQPANCAPIVASLKARTGGPAGTRRPAGTGGPETRHPARTGDSVACDFAPTIAEGAAIKRPVRMAGLLAAIRRSGGGALAIAEEDIRAAAFDLAQTGLYVEPTGALAAAGFDRLLGQGVIEADQTSAVVLTGGGLKATWFYEDALGQDAPG